MYRLCVGVCVCVNAAYSLCSFPLWQVASAAVCVSSHVVSSPTRSHCFKHIRSTTQSRSVAKHFTTTNACSTAFREWQRAQALRCCCCRRRRSTCERLHRHIVGGAKLFPFRFMFALKTR